MRHYVTQQHVDRLAEELVELLRVHLGERYGLGPLQHDTGHHGDGVGREEARLNGNGNADGLDQQE